MGHKIAVYGNLKLLFLVISLPKETNYGYLGAI
jgi:hypothetical protein